MKNRPILPAILLVLVAGAATADDPPDRPSAERRRTITVFGEGEASGAPDVAVTTLGVEALDPKLAAAVSDANRRMRSVLEAIKRAGIASRDIRTVEYSINFEQNPTPPRAAGEPEGRPSGSYRVRNTVQVTIRDLPRAGDVLDGAVAAGANAVSGIAFTIENPGPLRARAREAAVADARARAEALARASGVAVGPVVSISESSGGPVPRPMMARAMASMAPAPPIESGELSERAQVEIVFEISPRGP
ncbi:MAG TPA: SIMPL domain-containing protein [Thermoanaerobaculia bacterium]|nr:SIMPL domain-containing protein [Thermoanaerobaculia bacterium]